MLYDISRSISESILSYPGDPQPRIKRQPDVEQGDLYSFTQISFHSHCGTHLDAPRHFIPDGMCVDDYGPADFCPLVEVLDCRGNYDITARLLGSSIQRSDTAILLHTDASAFQTEQYVAGHPALTQDAAEFLTERAGRLLGIDYLSVERDGDGSFPVHRALLGAGFLLLEYVDLSAVPAGVYRLICLPLKLERAEAAPCRALLSTRLDPL